MSLRESWTSNSGQDHTSTKALLLDIDGDGFMDVLTDIGEVRNNHIQPKTLTRVWRPKESRWTEVETPFAPAGKQIAPDSFGFNLHFGILRQSGAASAFSRFVNFIAWTWDSDHWLRDKTIEAGLRGEPDLFKQ